MDERIAASAAQVSGQVDEMIRRMNAQAVFGEPIQQGEVTLIPVASVMYGFGSGQGWGRSLKATGDAAAEGDSEGAAGKPGEGAGAGGGGGGVAKPLGFIRIDANGARWEPTVEPTRIILPGMFLAGWIVFWVMKMIRVAVAAGGKRKNCC